MAVTWCKSASISRRQLARSVGAAAATVVAAACGSAPGQQPAARTGALQGKVFVLSYQTSSPRWDMQVRMYEEFNARHKGQGLEVDFVNPGQSVMEKATTLHVAGTPADMFEWPRLWREIEGIIGDLASFFKRDKIDSGVWIPESINVMKQGDHIWGMPVSISADATAVNLDLLAAAGLQPPPTNPDDHSWTMEKFFDLTQKLTRGTEQFGFTGGWSGGPAWMNAPTYFGYGPVDIRNRKVTINTPGYRQGLQFWVDFRNKHHLMPVGDEVNRIRSVSGQHLFVTGKVGMGVIFNLAERPSFRWMIAALPYTPSPPEPRNVAARISVHGLFIDSDSKNKEQAWVVFQHWMKPEHDAQYVLSDGHVVSPLLKGGFELTSRDFQDRMGTDPRAYFLQAQRSRVDGWHYYLLKDQGKARNEIDPLWTQTIQGTMAVGEFAPRAQELTERLASF